VSVYYVYAHRVEVYLNIYVFLFFTARAKVTYRDLIARGGRASFNRKLHYFLITFFVSSSSRGEKQQRRAHPAPRTCIAHNTYIHLCILVSYIYLNVRYNRNLYRIVYYYYNNATIIVIIIIYTLSRRRRGGTSPYSGYGSVRFN